MTGSAITIALQQLKGLLGIKNFTKKTDIVSVMRSVFSSAHHGVRFHFALKFTLKWSLCLFASNLGLQWNWETIVIGLAFLVFLLVAKYIVRMSKSSSSFSPPFYWGFNYHNISVVMDRVKRIRSSFGWLQFPL